jgi:hypothetical protein
MDALTRRLLMGAVKRRGIEYVGGAILPIAPGTTTPSIGLTSLTGGLASSPASGDFVVAMALSVRGSDMDLSASGYTQIAELHADDNVDTNLYVGRKFMGGSPDSSVTFSSDITNLFVLGVSVWRGVDPTTPLDVTPVTATGINSGIPNPPAITPVTAGSRIIVIGGSPRGTNDLTQAGSELANFMSDTATGGSIHHLAFGHYDDWVSGSFDPTAFQIDGSDSTSHSWAAATIALRPA